MDSPPQQRGRKHVLQAILGTLLLLILPAWDIPMDPGGTLERVKGDILRVGISHNPPWTVGEDNTVQGVEADLVREFARSLGARVEWVPGTEEVLMRALETQHLDLVVAGLTARTPWQKNVGLTMPYYEARYFLVMPQNSGVKPEEAERAGYPKGFMDLAAIITSSGRTAVEAGGDKGALPLAVPGWQLQADEGEVARHEFASRQHIMAVPPGENAFLLRLDRFLSGRQQQIESALQREGGPPS